jgi:hypothetical protein
VYGGRISGAEIFVLRVVDSKPVEAFALDTRSRALRPLAALSAVLNKHSAPDNACINPDGQTIIWGCDRQAGITDLNGRTDNLISPLPAAQSPQRTGFSVLWSPNGAKWLVVQYAFGKDTSWPEALVSGNKGKANPDKIRTDQSNWGSFTSVDGITDDGVVTGSDEHIRVVRVHMEGNKVTPLNPPMNPKGFDEIKLTPIDANKELWILKSVSSWRNSPVLNYFSKWTERWDSQTITLYIDSRGRNDRKVIGVIGPTPERWRQSGNGTLGLFRLSPDSRQIDFEWDEWLYTAPIN